MEIICISRYGIILWNICISVFFGRSHFDSFAESLCFFQSFLSPCTGIEICSFLFKEIIGNHTELHACSSTQEKYRIPFRNIQKFFKQGNSLVHYRLKVFSAVTDFHQRKSRTIVVKNSLSCFFDHFARQYRRSRIEIMFFHLEVCFGLTFVHSYICEYSDYF